MPLSPLEFVPREFYNLLTGAMPDQPVTLSNVVSVGGDQRSGAGLRVYGGLEVYTSRAAAEPSFGIDASGFTWAGTRFEYAVGGLRTGPLEVDGDLLVHGHIQGALPFEGYITRYFRELGPGTLAIQRGLHVGPVGDLQWAQAPLRVAAGGLGPLASFQCYAVNWLQFNVRVWDDDPSLAWRGKRLTLDFDVDNLTPGTAGRITLRDGKVGLGNIPDVEARFAELEAHIRRLELQLAVMSRRLLRVR